MHPYKNLPDRNFWKKAVSPKPWLEVFAGERAKFEIGPTDLVATAGSCFAQRISRHLKARGFGYTSFEPAHPLMDAPLASRLGYDTFSARYGNVYTTRQLRQLVDQAFGLCPPIIEIETARSGRFIDLLRPAIHDGGFASHAEAVADRLYHLERVKEMFLRCQVFIFTLGLTETWAIHDGQVFYGVHPAVATQRDIARDAVAVNLDYIDCYNDMVHVIGVLRQHNPTLRLVFTVSPVALAATHQAKHVLTATSYSKSVLRAVVGKLVDQCHFADYFPSYEIFNSAQSFGQYLAEDLRDVSLRGVASAMQLFEQMFFARQAVEPALPVAVTISPEPTPQHAPRAHDPASVECEEILNAAFG